MKKLIKELLPKKYYIEDTGKIYNQFDYKLSTFVTNSGYEAIHVQNHNFTIHRLVAKYFCSGEKPGLVVDHINNNRLDNRASNLRWVTEKENNDDMVSRGRNNTKLARQAIAKKRKTSVKMIDKDTDKVLKIFDSIGEAAEYTKASRNQITMVANHTPQHRPNGRTYYAKTAKGYKWEYATENNNQPKAQPITLINQQTGQKYSFKSLNQAAKFLGKNSATVMNWVHRHYTEHDGYDLKY